MVPALKSGDFVLSFARVFSPYKANDIVVVRHPKLGNIIKRIQKIDSNKRVRLIGDNALSTSSDEIGWQEPDTVLGRVVWRIASY